MQAGRGSEQLDRGPDAAALDLLAEVSELLSRRDQERAVTELARLVVPRLADWCTVTVTLGRHDRRTLGWAHREPALEPLLASYAEVQAAAMNQSAAISVCLRTGEPVDVPQIPPLEEWVPDPAARARLAPLHPGSVTVLPLRAGDRTLGAIALVTMRERGPLSARERELALEVARRAGLALDNARLYEEQRQLVETLQRSLLTAPPAHGPVEIAVRYVAAAAEAKVGGDWYDAFRLPDGSTVLTIGDVVGHDSQAAAAMGQLRSLLRGIGYATSAQPALLLTRLDETMQGLELDTTASAVVLRAHPAPPGGSSDASFGELELEWSNAGHPPPLLAGPGRCDLLEAEPDILLGIDPAADRHRHRAVLGAGSTLLLYTDGLVEGRDLTLDDGIARVRRALVELEHLPLEDLCDALLARLVVASPDDDVALLAARLRPDGPTLTASS